MAASRTGPQVDRSWTLSAWMVYWYIALLDRPPMRRSCTGWRKSDAPGTIKEKPGGCGCRLAESGRDGGAGLGFAALVLSSVLLRRSRKRAA